MEKLLQVGNVFELKKGMKVTARITENFCEGAYESPFFCDIEVGCTYGCTYLYSKYKDITNIYELSHTIEKLLKEQEINVDTDKMNHFFEFYNLFMIPRDNIFKIDTSAFLGEYVVTEIKCDKFHKVIAKKLNPDTYEIEGTEIFFYQKEGLFANVVAPVKLCWCGEMNLTERR